MQDNEFYVSSSSGKELFGKFWFPEGNPRAVIAVLHGLGDHIGRYENFGHFFSKNQIAVIGFDQRGHGRSAGKRGHSGNYASIMTDIQLLLLETRRRFTDMPMFLFGHSMGGNFALNYALRHTSREIRGVILSAPFIYPNGIPSDSKILNVRAVNRLFPFLTLSCSIDPMELTHDPSAGIKYLGDPVKHDRISLRLYRELSRSSSWIIENAAKMAYPVLIMHGRDDRISSWNMSKKISGMMPKTADLRIWEGMRHELHHERSSIEVLEFMLSWICKHLEGQESV